MIYGAYARTTGFMSPENLVEFLMKEQREKATLADANSIIKNFEPDENGESSFFLSSFIRTGPRQPSPCPHSQGEAASVQRRLPPVLAPS